MDIENRILTIEKDVLTLTQNQNSYSDTIEVSLSIVNERLCVSVKDNGWGIAPCHQKKLFTQFYRVPRSEEQQQKGYGIGLAQSQYIINEHGGEIMVKSAEGEGSTFTFIIPCR